MGVFVGLEGVGRTVRRHAGRNHLLTFAVLFPLSVLSLLALAWLASGCGSGSVGGAAEKQRATVAESTAAGPTTSSSGPQRGFAVTVWESPGARVADVFAKLKPQAHGLRLYAPTKLPAGTGVSSYWWPVTSDDQAVDWESKANANPRISVQETANEIRVVLRRDAQWLEIIEGVRGDIGDSAGRSAGSVDGHRAELFQVGEASVVQWEDGGSWYAVCARGFVEEDVIRIAQDMRSVVE